MKAISKTLTMITRWGVLVWLIAAGCPKSAFSAEPERGLSIENGSLRGPQQIMNSQGKRVVLYKESHALVIGISNYTNGWPNLPGVKKDVEEAKAVLEAQGFNVVVKMDLDNLALDQAFDEFISQYGNDPENRLLFYFAGHGHTVRTSYGEELGYIVPADAPNPNKDLPNFQRTAMEMQQIEIYAKRIQSKHALFLFDACFSGSLFALSRAVPEIISYKTSQPVRQFITSGSADETVPDESIFRAQFARALQGEADTDKDGYVTGAELGEFLQKTVVNYSYNAQHPQYGKIRNPNLDKGDFIFMIPLDKQKASVSSPKAEPPEVKFSLDDLETQIKWQRYLTSMEEAFAKVEEYEQAAAPVDSKVAAWERFISSFTEDNPYSTRDEELGSAAKERIQQWKSEAVASPSPTPRPEQLSLTKSGFRINKVVLKNKKGKVITPVDDIYAINVGETVTLTMDVEYPRNHTIKATWTARNGKVFSTSELINIYTAKKPGPDVVVIYLLDEDTSDALEESVMLTVAP